MPCAGAGESHLLSELRISPPQVTEHGLAFHSHHWPIPNMFSRNIIIILHSLETLSSSYTGFFRYYLLKVVLFQFNNRRVYFDAHYIPSIPSFQDTGTKTNIKSFTPLLDVFRILIFSSSSRRGIVDSLFKSFPEEELQTPPSKTVQN